MSTRQLIKVFNHFQDPANDRSWWPLPQDHVESIPLLTAAVRLSGMMEDAENETDLQAAVEHCRALVNMDAVTMWSWCQESMQVEKDIEDWLERVGAMLQAGMH